LTSCSEQKPFRKISDTQFNHLKSIADAEGNSGRVVFVVVKTSLATGEARVKSARMHTNIDTGQVIDRATDGLLTKNEVAGG
jgi:hypothetical protein